MRFENWEGDMASPAGPASPIPASFEGLEWGKLLQNTSEDAVLDGTHGKLIASSETFEIKLLNPTTREEIRLKLEDIVQISKDILTRGLEGPRVKEINDGLKHLEAQVRASVVRHHFGGKNDSFHVAADFYEARREISSEIEATPESRLKNRISEMAVGRVERRHIAEIRTLVRENRNLLFELTEAHESFFHLAKRSCTPADIIPLLADVLMDMPSLEKSHVEQLKDFLFRKDLPDGSSLFQELMKEEKANHIFDAILQVISGDELNIPVNRHINIQMMEYAHTTKRYEYIFLKLTDLSPPVTAQADLAYRELRFLFDGSIRDQFSRTPNYARWLKSRRESSTTIASGDPRKIEESAARWNRAEELRSMHSNRDRRSRTRFDWRTIEQMHFELCRGEDGIENPGKLRTGIVRTSGGWAHFYCPKPFLDANVTKFIEWMNEGLIQCEQGKLNPIIFSAQVYQRCVSFHPFENANGRIARLAMDYVLERFHLVPPILGKDVLDAVFPMDLPKTATQNEFIMKIIHGIKASQRELMA